MSPIPVLVTGTGGTGVGAGIIQALAMEPGRWDVTAADANPFSWGLYAAPRGVLVPWASDPGYLKAVADVIAETGAAAVIPGTEAETALLAGHRDELGIPVIANDAALMTLMRDKIAAQARLAELGLATIPSYPWDARYRAAAGFGLPLVVKPSRDSSGSRGVHLVTTLRELEALDPLVTPGSIVQPYLDGPEYTVGVLSDRAGKVIDSIVLRRELTGVSLLSAAGGAAVSTGFSQGHIVRDDRIQDYCEDLAVRLGSAGPLNFQLRATADAIYVLEIHPRFSFSAPLRAAAGFNEPGVLLRHWLGGGRPGRLGWRHDVAAIRCFGHVLVPAAEMLKP